MVNRVLSRPTLPTPAARMRAGRDRRCGAGALGRRLDLRGDLVHRVRAQDQEVGPGLFHRPGRVGQDVPGF